MPATGPSSNPSRIARPPTTLPASATRTGKSIPSRPSINREETPIKVGFEAEFQTGAVPLIATLNRQGHAGMSELHSYHCDCEWCCVTDNPEWGGESYLFRAQSDSSCNGEIITRILRGEDEVATAAILLQEAALDVDAEPGLNAGFHVHSDLGLLIRDRYVPQAFAEYLAWEPTLETLSAGRWTDNRGNNRNVREAVRVYMRDDMLIINDLRADSNTAAGVWSFHSDNDRHSNLNVSTRHNTWEFRLWNSTRSAWRMEMFCGLSAAFTDPCFVELSQESGLDPDDPIHVAGPILENVLRKSDHATTAELVARQRGYLRERAPACQELAFTA